MVGNAVCLTVYTRTSSSPYSLDIRATLLLQTFNEDMASYTRPYFSHNPSKIMVMVVAEVVDGQMVNGFLATDKTYGVAPPALTSYYYCYLVYVPL